MTQLSKTERTTLNAAMDIILKHTPKEAHWMFSGMNYGNHPSYNVTYFDTTSEQHRLWQRGATFADKVQMGLNIESNVETTANARTAARIEQLRSELRDLTGEVA